MFTLIGILSQKKKSFQSYSKKYCISYMSWRAEAAVQFGHVLLLADLLRRAAAHQVAERLDGLRDQRQGAVRLRILKRRQVVRLTQRTYHV